MSQTQETAEIKFTCENCEKSWTLGECEVVISDVDAGGKHFKYFDYRASKYDPEPTVKKVRGSVEIYLDACCPDCENTIGTAKVETPYIAIKPENWKPVDA
jgi:hypothetical protein